jgi:Rieske Fe-S protein
MRQESAPDGERSEPVSTEDGPGQEPPVEGNTRRGLLMGVGLAGVGGVLAACGGSSNAGEATAPAEPAASAPAGGSTSAPAGTAPAGKAPAGKAPAGKGLAKTTDIPVGGGKIFKAEKVVVTQPKAGEFRAFSAVCTHMGCTVGSVSHGTINCPCHGSKFKIADASVAAGPAPGPLPSKKIEIKRGEITVT